MSDRPKAKAAGIGDAAVQAKTGKTWAEWFTILDRAGAAAWPHKQIAAYLRDHYACPRWWTQMVTVGYEQARGLRVKNQTATGFNASVSKTIGVPVAVLYAAWTDPDRLAKWLPDGQKMTVRKATANKSIRATWIDGSTSLEAMFWVKGDAKSQVVVEHRKLKSAAAVARIKAYWGTALLELKNLLEAPAATGIARAPARTPAKRKRSASS